MKQTRAGTIEDLEYANTKLMIGTIISLLTKSHTDKIIVETTPANTIGMANRRTSKAIGCGLRKRSSIDSHNGNFF